MDAAGPILYSERTRKWYDALGYAEPYRWARFDEVPFTPMRTRLAKATVAIVTTAAPYRPEKGEQGPGAPYNAAAKFFEVYAMATAGSPDVRVAHVGIDRKHTSMADPNTWFPLAALRAAAAGGRIGALSRRFYGVPTDRSQSATLDTHAPAVLAMCREDAVDVAVLVPNCPVCHQSLSLVARHLEHNGIPTVLMGCAKDIVERCGVPRFLFSDFPLGNAAGRPHDPAAQRETLELALGLLESATGPRTTRQSPLRWSDDPAWKLDYMNTDTLSGEQARDERARSDANREIVQRLRGGI